MIDDSTEAGTVCVLVDGVGNMREILMTRAYYELRVPMLRDPATHWNAFPQASSPDVFKTACWQATFQRVGRLPDDRVVYGFCFPAGTPPFSLWNIKTSWVEELPADGVALVAREMELAIDALTAQAPIVRLFDQTRHDSAAHEFTRVVMGVGRKAEGKP